MPHDDSIYLGFDPGGRGKFGAAILSSSKLETSTFNSAKSAADWAVDRCYGRTPLAAGIDTLLHWYDGQEGGRPVDAELRKRYPEASNSVVSQGSLRGSMVIGGILLAAALRKKWPSLILNETHPKLLLFDRIGKRFRDDRASVLKWFRNECSGELSGGTRNAGMNDDELDAALSAWVTRKALLEDWDNLLASEANIDQVWFPVGDVRYHWPQTKPPA